MIGLPLTLLLLWTTPGTEPVRVVAPPWSAVDVDAKEASFFSERLAGELSRRGLQVTTAEDIANSLGIARQRELLGCAETSESCLLELTNALGAEAILSGSVARLDGRLHLEVKVISQRSARSIASSTAEADSHGVMVSALPIVAEQLARGALAQRLAPSARPTTERGEVRLGARRFAWMFGAGGGALLLTGGGFLLDAHLRHQRLVGVTTTPLTESQAQEERISGARSQVLGWTLGGVGAAALVTAGTLLLFGGDGVVRSGVTVAVTPDGAQVRLTGELP